MSESPTEKCLKSLQVANEDIIKCSLNTILSSSTFKNLPDSMIAEWLQGEEIEKMFRRSFEEFQVDEKFNKLKDLKEQSKPCVTVEQKMQERKKFLEDEVKKFREEIIQLESKINEHLMSLNNIPEANIEPKIIT
ncbi:hypothetical protein GWI33_023232 [Rhynchophorus ferrugineus]|uniref:Uncharacterized protein n=1 Tax=Rhynchophorus ferrugineus TaxID=354439 RepID=A0A834M2H2_RHYFE|nr:hypothetical protein GWI33_023232 [Rhynchophorus ferrugineus]